MLVALTGTPGTGKSTAAELLRYRGREVREISDIVRSGKVSTVLDEERGSLEVDTEELDEVVGKELEGRDALLVGHLSHFLSVDLIIVLRCRPSVLAERLRVRGWSDDKVGENVEAEGCDVILVEAVENGAEVAEIDTTDLPAERVADAIEEVLAGEREKYAAGHVDWSDEVMGWF
jgi:adenylate kinase